MGHGGVVSAWLCDTDWREIGVACGATLPWWPQSCPSDRVKAPACAPACGRTVKLRGRAASLPDRIRSQTLLNLIGTHSQWPLPSPPPCSLPARCRRCAFAPPRMTSLCRSNAISLWTVAGCVRGASLALRGPGWRVQASRFSAPAHQRGAYPTAPRNRSDVLLSVASDSQHGLSVLRTLSARSAPRPARFGADHSARTCRPAPCRPRPPSSGTVSLNSPHGYADDVWPVRGQPGWSARPRRA